MTRKIFQSTVLIVLLCIALCTALFLGALYGYFEDQVYDELASEARLAAQGIERTGADFLRALDTDNRLTLVAPDGTVLADTHSDAAALPNHAGREEIAQALESGSGRSAHYSQVYLAKTLYYALRLSDGSVLRVACVQNTVVSLLLGMLTPILWVIVLALIVAGLLASRLARRITKPINELDLDHPSLDETYRELTPLLLRLRQQNVTIRAQLDELSRRQREFEAITENMSEGFLLIDGRGRVLSHNSSALRILGIDAPAGSDLPLTRSNVLRRAAAAALAGEHTEALMHLSGRVYQLLGNPVCASGQVTGAVLMILDVTEREQRDQLRREFTANVSHELKTPLTSISGFAELMKDGLVGEQETREFAGDIYRQSRRLISLVGDIIKLSQLDSSEYAPEREDVDLHALAQEVLASLGPSAKLAKVTLTLTGEVTVVRAVRQIAEELIWNLCDNAVKYNHPGGSVRVFVGTEDGHALVRVSDTGIGIPAAEQSRVFERFYRVDKSHSRQIGGTGLGLSIVKHGAQFLGAKLALESTEGVGTSVTVTF